VRIELQRQGETWVVAAPARTTAPPRAPAPVQRRGWW
jgi:hypothetical protein